VALTGETVTLIRRSVTGRDVDGNDIKTDVRTPAPGAVFAPAGSIEQVQGEDLVSSTASVTWLNACPSLKAVDAVERANGDRYEITGDPQDFQSPFTQTRVLTVHLTKVTG
jgi:hypothetical protein